MSEQNLEHIVLTTDCSSEAASRGEVVALNGQEIEALYCFTSEEEVCFCWLLIRDDTLAYRFFTELAYVSSFESYDKAEFFEELEEYQQEGAVVDLTQQLKVKGRVISSIRADSKLGERFITLDICTQEGLVIRLTDNELNGEGGSTLWIKLRDETGFQKLL